MRAVFCYFTRVVDQHIHIAKGGGRGAHFVPDTDIQLKGRDLDLGVFLEQVLFQVLEAIFAAGSQELKDHFFCFVGKSEEGFWGEFLDDYFPSFVMS